MAKRRAKRGKANTLPGMSLAEIEVARRSLAELATALPYIKGVLAAARAGHPEPESDDVAGVVVRYWQDQAIENSVRTIYDHAQSPIERLLWGAVVVGLAAVDPLGGLFLGPTDDAPAMVASVRFRYAMAQALEEKFREGYTGPGDEEADAFLAWLQQHCTADEALYLRQTAVEGGVGFAGMPRLQLQATFPGIDDGRGFRPDLFVWVPNLNKPGLIVECDGFDYHTTREAFERDRRRDRIFHTLGYQTLRYSGAEIHRDPFAASVDVMQAVWRFDGTAVQPPPAEP